YDVETGADAGAKLELLNKHGNKSGDWIVLLGADSKAYQERLAEHNRARLSKIQKAAASRASLTSLDGDIMEEGLQRLAVCVKDWSFKTSDGQAFPCTFDSALKVLKSSTLIREQVEAFVHDRSNYATARSGARATP